MQFPTTTTTPWSFYSHKLQMRLTCTPSVIPARGAGSLRLSVKSEITVRTLPCTIVPGVLIHLADV